MNYGYVPRSAIRDQYGRPMASTHWGYDGFEGEGQGFGDLTYSKEEAASYCDKTYSDPTLNAQCKEMKGCFLGVCAGASAPWTTLGKNLRGLPQQSVTAAITGAAAAAVTTLIPGSSPSTAPVAPSTSATYPSSILAALGMGAAKPAASPLFMSTGGTFPSAGQTSGGMSTTTKVLIGGAAVLGIGAALMLWKSTRRSPALSGYKRRKKPIKRRSR